MALGPLLFAQPLVLIGLLILPLIWLLLRASPPPPMQTELPSLRLLDEVESREETPQHTPWWVIVLRLLAASLAIVGFAEPSWSPTGPSSAREGPALLVIDDGWTSAARWGDVVDMSVSAVKDLAAEGRDIHLLFTAPRRRPRPLLPALDSRSANRILRAHRPAAWAPDRADARDRLMTSGLRPTSVVWINDGLQRAGDATELAQALGRIAASISVHHLPPRGAYAIFSSRRSGARTTVRIGRHSTQSAGTTSVIARSNQGLSIASGEGVFAKGVSDASVIVEAPSLVLDDVISYRLARSASAGAVWLVDATDIRPRVGLADATAQGQPLLQEFHYVRQALLPHADLIEGSLAKLLDAAPDALILSDRRINDPNQARKLADWLEAGGALIRFAGPHLAAKADDFTPVTLRAATRALGGALAWQTPQKLAAMTSGSPFAGIAPPRDALVYQQILAEPGPGLAAKTWAKLEDGTPLVTAERRGQGVVILFHVTATPGWSDLPYTDSFETMLHRASMAGQINSDSTAQETPEASLSPVRLLDAFGQTMPPDGETAPLSGKDFATAEAGPFSPPGLYSGPLGLRALNTARIPLSPINDWPAGTRIIDDQTVLWRDFRGWLLSLAFTLLCLDLMVTLIMSGVIARILRIHPSVLLIALCVSGVMTALPPAHGQQTQDAAANRVREAALSMRLAYVKTGDRRHDDVTRAGLVGLGRQLLRRTAVEPDTPHGVDLATDKLEVYPLIVYAPMKNTAPLPPQAAQALNTYLRNGGAVLIDLRDSVPGERIGDTLAQRLDGVDIPPLIPLPKDHVLTRSFYLLKTVSGRIPGTQLWLDSPQAGDPRSGDGVASIFIGGADWVGAWAVDARGRPLLPVEGGQKNRENAYRFGINLVMYVLTGNYKEDQVHLPDLLKRLGLEKEKKEDE